MPHCSATAETMKSVKHTLRLTGFLHQMPIWRNRFYRDLVKVVRHSVWKRAEIRYIAQILNDSVMKPYVQLSREFPMLKGHCHQYQQLQHSMRCQRRHSNLCLEDSAFLESIYTDPEKKGIISQIYTHLLSHIQAPDLVPCRKGWKRDVSPIDGEQWFQIGVGPLVSFSVAQRHKSRSAVDPSG